MPFNDDMLVKMTVGELVKLVNLCVWKDRQEEPEQIDYGEYVKSFLQWDNNEIENKEMA